MASRPSTRRTAVGALARPSCAFDRLELNGEDRRPQAFGNRKAKLARLLARTGPGIAVNEHIEADGTAVFAEACRMGLEGIVSKRLNSPYRSGRSGDWIKTKNPNSPAMQRFRENWWQKRSAQ